MRARTALLCAGIASAFSACLFPTLDGLSSVQDAAGQDVTTGPDAPSTDVATAPEPDAPEASTIVDAGPCPVSEPNLAAYYRLDEGNGPTAYDCSGNKRDGFMVSGGASSWTVGRNDAGAALHVDLAGNGCLTIGNFPAITGAMTVSAWVMSNSFPPDGGNKQYIASKTLTYASAGWRLAASYQPLYGYGIVKPADAGGTYETNITQVPPLGVWTHLAAVYTPGTSVDIYMNGVLINHHLNSPAAIIDDPQAAFRIGCRGDNNDYFDGNIDEVRVYDRALTAQEITALAK